jgi:hypothetical protein
MNNMVKDPLHYMPCSWPPTDVQDKKHPRLSQHPIWGRSLSQTEVSFPPYCTMANMFGFPRTQSVWIPSQTLARFRRYSWPASRIGVKTSVSNVSKLSTVTLWCWHRRLFRLPSPCDGFALWSLALFTWLLQPERSETSLVALIDMPKKILTLLYALPIISPFHNS